VPGASDISRSESVGMLTAARFELVNVQHRNGARTVIAAFHDLPRPRSLCCREVSPFGKSDDCTRGGPVVALAFVR
jgi:hypothetical protein